MHVALWTRSAPLRGTAQRTPRAVLCNTAKNWMSMSSGSIRDDSFAQGEDGRHSMAKRKIGKALPIEKKDRRPHHDQRSGMFCRRLSQTPLIIARLVAQLDSHKLQPKLFPCGLCRLPLIERYPVADGDRCPT